MPKPSFIEIQTKTKNRPNCTVHKKASTIKKILKIIVGWDFTYQQPRRQISAGPSAHQTPPNLEISKTCKHTHPPDQTPTSETLVKITNSGKGTPLLVLCGPAAQGRRANPPSLCAPAPGMGISPLLLCLPALGKGALPRPLCPPALGRGALLQSSRGPPAQGRHGT